MARTTWGVVGGLVAVGLIAVSIFYIGRSSESAPDVPVSPAVEPPVDVADEDSAEVFDPNLLPPERARELEDGVNARDPDLLTDVLLVDDEIDVALIAEQALPPGAELLIDESTFEPLEPDGATVAGMIDGPEGTWQVDLWLTEQAGRWMLTGSGAPQAGNGEAAG